MSIANARTVISLGSLAFFARNRTGIDPPQLLYYFGGISLRPMDKLIPWLFQAVGDCVDALPSVSTRREPPQVASGNKKEGFQEVSLFEQHLGSLRGHIYIRVGHAPFR